MFLAKLEQLGLRPSQCHPIADYFIERIKLGEGRWKLALTHLDSKTRDGVIATHKAILDHQDELSQDIQRDYEMVVHPEQLERAKRLVGDNQSGCCESCKDYEWQGDGWSKPEYEEYPVCRNPTCKCHSKDTN